MAHRRKRSRSTHSKRSSSSTDHPSGFVDNPQMSTTDRLVYADQEHLDMVDKGFLRRAIRERLQDIDNGVMSETDVPSHVGGLDISTGAEPYDTIKKRGSMARAGLTTVSPPFNSADARSSYEGNDSSALPEDLRYHDAGDAIGKGGQYISDHVEVLSTPASTEGRLKSKIDIGNRETLAAPVVDASEAWADCARQVWEREEITVEKWKDEIANLLTFAGLFSAALTAFNVQYYISLQPPSVDTNTQILMAMSVQLSVLAVHVGHANMTPPVFTEMIQTPSSDARLPAHVISINTLWFSALVFSLSAASLAISASQWLHHHIDRAATLSRQDVRIWCFRHRGLSKWHIPVIISILPILLQISLALFLIGLVQLLWTLNVIVAGVIMTLVIVLLLVSMGTAFVPMLAPDCPFKSPQAWWSFLVLRRLMKILYILAERVQASCFPLWWDDSIRGRIAKIGYRLSHQLCRAIKTWAKLQVSNWREFDDSHVRSQKVEADQALAMLVEADAIIRDDFFPSKVVLPCLQASDLSDALPAFYRILEQRAHESDNSKDPPTLKWYQGEQDGQLVITLGNMCIDMFNRSTPAAMQARGLDQNTHNMRILRILESLLNAMPNTSQAGLVYRRLFAFMADADVSLQVRTFIAYLIWGNRFRFDVPVNDVRTLLLGMPNCKSFDPVRFLWITYSILNMATSLPPSDIDQIQDDLKNTLVLMAEYFNPPDLDDLVLRVTESGSWTQFWLFLEACSNLAGKDASLFASDSVQVLERFASRRPNYADSSLPSTIRKLQQMVALSQIARSI